MSLFFPLCFASQFFSTKEKCIRPTIFRWNLFGILIPLYFICIKWNSSGREKERARTSCKKIQIIFSACCVTCIHMLGFYCMSNMKYSFYIEFKLWLTMRSKQEWGDKCRARKQNVYLNAGRDEKFHIEYDDLFRFDICVNDMRVGESEKFEALRSVRNGEFSKMKNIWHGQHSNPRIHTQIYTGIDVASQLRSNRWWCWCKYLILTQHLIYVTWWLFVARQLT